MKAWHVVSLAALFATACFSAVEQNDAGTGGGGGSATGGGAGGGSATGGGTGGGSATGGGSGGGTGGGSSTGGGAGGGTGGGSATGGGSGGGGGGGSSTGGGAGGGGGVVSDGGNECGGFPGFVCSSTDVCIWMDKSCGAADGIGACQPRPQGCTAVYDPVCGCDGMVYSNECVAQAAGADVSRYGLCTPPNGYFNCGWKFCALGSTYCEAVIGGAVGGPGQYTCQPMPMGCGTSPSCSCLSGQTCGGSCQGSASGGFTLTCYAP